MLSRAINRRRFLRSSVGRATAIGIGASLPLCLSRAAEAQSAKSENILIVVQMSGGNDGLNTVIPYADEAYRAARPKLAIATSDVLRCNDHVGFHPAMSGLRDLLEAGHLAVVQGVGYDQPNRSHFESMDIWHTCQRKEQSRDEGWLGRFLDTQATPTGGDVPALHLGREQQPLAVASKHVRVPTVRDLAEFQLRGADRQALRTFLNTNLPTTVAAEQDTDDLLNFLSSSTVSALAASQRVTEAAQDYQSEVPYPETELGRKLQIVAQLIDAGLTTRVYYVQLDGFDTHAQQAQTHTVLLREWSEAVSALMIDLQSRDHLQRVCLMTFSEFGRRVAENASDGTDHGAAGPMFLCGGSLQAGMVGVRPSLTDLQEGDLKHHVDFRQVYATVLESWLGCNPHPILGGDYERLPLFS